MTVFRKADEFPRTPTGKVHKPRLTEELAKLPPDQRLGIITAE